MIRLVLAVVAGLLVLPDFARADDLPVTTTADGNDGACIGDLDCTLREAVEEGGSGDTVILGPNQYELTMGQLVFTDAPDIDGAGARSTTIHSNGTSRVGFIQTGSATLTDLAVTGGVAPGGAAQADNAGGAFYVDAAGELRLIGVALKNNDALARGGAIATFGDLSLVESVVSGNHAGNSPGISGLGGGIYIGANAGAVLLRNSTISGNVAEPGENFSAGGGLYAVDGYTSDFVTFANNMAVSGGGLWHGVTSSFMNNTVFADNTGDSCAGSVGMLNESHNLAEDTTCDFDETGDLEVADAKLGPLADNGGSTDTHGLFPGSPAINAADPLFCPATDQRGEPRNSNGPCAMGAFEGTIGVDFTVNVDYDNAGPGPCDPLPGDCTLREALVAASPNDAVILPADTYVVEHGALTLEGDTIAGAGARDSVIEAASANNDRVLNVISGANEVAGVTITGGRSPNAPSAGLGGGILVTGATTSLLMSNVTVTQNSAFEGGGIGTTGGTLTISRSTISRNSAIEADNGTSGGGMWLSGTTTQLTNVTISGNLAQGAEVPDAEGGGIKIIGGSLTTNSVTIADNGADTGSAIHREPAPTSTVTLVNTIVAADGPFFGCTGGPFAGNHNVLSDSSCGTPAKNPLLAPLVDNTGQTDTHAIGATSPAVDGGLNCEATDQRGQLRKRACDIGAYEFQGNLPPSGGGGPSGPPPPPPDNEKLPPPVAGKNVNALPKSGTVKIKLPGSDTFVDLVEGQQIPVGTIVDARKGHVTLIAAGGGDAEFYGGIFKIGQTKGAKPLTTLSLTEKLTCPKSKASAAAKKKRKRRLWGDGTGRFRTKGKHSAATVVGTKWLVEDRCTSTLTRVARGKVKVRDFVKKKTVTVKAPKKYVAKAKP